ncbi:hypothetical protein Dda_0556 [Drechslerella dactyloides]|uniref:DUF7732 domain-containing protein n=1 Tax=Drechslerella dactyloides TaxID=74499 RepID=A0AAD6J542_DREDA|nr:hypothetical protein Dda_0556 [Drechslerella dactyloides]
MKYSALHVAATTLLFASLSQLPAAVSAVALSERSLQQRTPVALEQQNAIKRTGPLADAEDVARRVTFDKREEPASKALVHFQHLEKRKGGGGGGGGGGGRGGGGSSGGKSSGGSSGDGKTTSSGGKSSTSGGKSSTSGGKTSSGNYKGYKTYGGRYGGGATSGYKAGGRSPLGLAPVLLPLGAIALIFPGLWLYSVYSYKYNTAYQYYNNTLNQLQTVPVQCLCMQYSDCGCDDNGNTTYLAELVALNQSNTTVFATVDKVWTLLINGTVENGTGPAAGDTISEAGSVMNQLGYIWMVGIACYLAYSM